MVYDPLAKQVTNRDAHPRIDFSVQKWVIFHLSTISWFTCRNPEPLATHEINGNMMSSNGAVDIILEAVEEVEVVVVVIGVAE